MSSLYDIKASLERLFEEIEEEGGVITEEQSKLLEVKEEELNNKLEQYVKAVQVYDNYIEECKAEEKRIKQRRDVYTSRIKYLKDAILEAVCKFGRQTKTNKVIELPTFRLSTRTTKSVHIDEDRLHRIVCEFERFISELVNNSVLCGGDELSLDDFIAAMNANLIAEYGDDFEPITLDDLSLITVNYNTTRSLKELLVKDNRLLQHFGENVYINMDTDINKKTVKDELPFNANNTVTELVENLSLIIK